MFFMLHEITYSEYKGSADNLTSYNVGRKVIQFEVTALLTEVYTKTATIKNANRFKAAGIWPVNREVFNVAYFVASGNLVDIIPEGTSVENTQALVNSQPTMIQEEVIPSTSGFTPEVTLRVNKRSKTILTVQKIKLLAKVTGKYGERVSEGAHKVAISMESPYRN
ncbi:hypothetical protein JTB14_022712 [Gonioctena quinquepunctata]|nr:hypothetical protein JTB14_022712 [Gonioctena quinquepunctata]